MMNYEFIYMYVCCMNLCMHASANVDLALRPKTIRNWFLKQLILSDISYDSLDMGLAHSARQHNTELRRHISMPARDSNPESQRSSHLMS
jgi:hypothetical protein